MLDLKAQHESLKDEIIPAVQGVLESQHFILGPIVKELEAEIAQYCGCSYAIGCASGSDALLLGLMAMGVERGDEVITTPFTFFATAGSIARLGAKPVFIDIEPDSFNINTSMIESAVTDRTRVILPVHLFGQCGNMDVINALAGKKGIAVLEDAAQAIGAEFKGKRAGNIGNIGAFSFYPSKNLGGAGDGGMLTTNDPVLADSLRSLRTHGAKKKYFHDHIGVNSRLDSIQAAILLVKFKHLDEWASKRRENAENYRALFTQSGLAANGNVTLPAETPDCFHVYNQFTIRVKSRDELKLYLKDVGIGTEI